MTRDNFATLRAQAILARHAADMDLTIAEFLASGNAPRFSHPRQDAMREIRERTPLTFAQIAKLFGGINHATVIYGVRCSAARAAGEVYRQKPSTAGRRGAA